MRWTEYIIFLAIVAALALPVGLYLARVSQRRRTFLDPLLRPVESILHWPLLRQTADLPAPQAR